jgi:sarcosine oxidase
MLLPMLRFEDHVAGRYEMAGAGHISPRLLVAAQVEAARRGGAEVIAAEVSDVGEGWCAAGGIRIEADQLLVAAGAWSDSVLGRAPVHQVMERTVAFLEVDEIETARIGRMPSLVFEADNDPYVLPPIRYPDGRIYLKIGGDPEDRPIEGDAALAAWFRQGGAPDTRDLLEAQLRALVPDLSVRSVSMSACVTTWTGDRMPEIARLSDRLVICAAGNGAGAKCSDELGRRGAALAVNDERLGL